MSRLLELFLRSAGDKAKCHTNYWNGPCPKCVGNDRFIVWPERDERLGEVCAAHGIRGIWSCRQCGKSGDTIAYLMELEDMTFPEACAELGIKVEGRTRQRRRTPQPPRSAEARVFKPHTWNDPSPEWQAYAQKLLDEAREAITRFPKALTWLDRRGLDRTAVERYGLGYLPPENKKGNGRYRHRSALALPPKTKPDGSEQKLIYIPRGIVIPIFDSTGKVIRLRFRRHKEDIDEFGEKYIVLEGSSPAPLLLEPEGIPGHLAVYVVQEAELDAEMLHYRCGYRVGSFAALTNLGKPDASQHPVLAAASRLLIAHDFDKPKPAKHPDGTPKFHPDGSPVLVSPGATGWAWWRDMYQTATRWPVPKGKDPGEAFAAGVDIPAWVEAGLPASFPCSLSAAGTGTMGRFSSGLDKGGEGAAKRNMPLPMQSEDKNTATVPSLPGKLRDLAARMRRVPGLTLTKNESGGLRFDYDRAWTHASEENWNFFGSVHSALLDDDDVFRFVMGLPETRITAVNLVTSLEQS